MDPAHLRSSNEGSRSSDIFRQQLTLCHDRSPRAVNERSKCNFGYKALPLPRRRMAKGRARAPLKLAAPAR